MNSGLPSPFDLRVPEHLGNCEDCFFKDEADLATAMLDPRRTTDREDFINIERDYAPMRRGRSSYAQILAEAPARMKIRAALAEGRPYSVDLPKKRVRLIVAQEVERARVGSPGFACDCDAAKSEDFDSADAEATDTSNLASTRVTEAKGWVCADCGIEYSDHQPCASCGSVRVVLVSVVKEMFGDNWREACFPT